MASQTGSIDLSSALNSKTYTEAQLQMKVDAVDGTTDLISNINAIADRINLYADYIRFSPNSANSVLQEIQQIKDAIVIDTSVPSITIGDSASGMNLVLESGILKFRDKLVEMAYMTGSALYVSNSLSFGHYIFYERDNGHFTLKRIV